MGPIDLFFLGCLSVAIALLDTSGVVKIAPAATTVHKKSTKE